MNPLANIVASLGISADDMSGLVGRNCTTALSAEPDGQVKTFLDICQSLGVNLRLAGSPPLHFWCDPKKMDDLYKDNEFRRQQKLMPLPEDRIGYWRLIKKIKPGHNLPSVCRRLAENFVPTWESGARHWNRGTIAYFSDRFNPKGRGASRGLPNQTFIEDWREFVISAWLQDAVPDKAWFVRYGLEWKEEDGKLIFTTTQRVPIFLRRMLERNMDVPWMKYGWESCPTQLG